MGKKHDLDSLQKFRIFHAFLDSEIHIHFHSADGVQRQSLHEVLDVLLGRANKTFLGVFHEEVDALTHLWCDLEGNS